MYNGASNLLFLTGYFLIFLGIIIIFIAIFISIFKSKSIKDKAEKKGGGIVFIGPIPIIFGTDIRVAKWLIIIALIITFALILLTIVAIYLV